jgi:hypothetical protein
MEAERKMLKSRFVVTAVTLALFVALAPMPSQAASHGWTAVSVMSAGPVSSLFEKIGRWWNHALNGPDRRQPAATQGKIGCGIDPNGSPLCGTGPDPDPLTTPEPADPKG